MIADAGAGITLGVGVGAMAMATALATAMALAIDSGVKPEQDFASAIVGRLVVALLGGSNADRRAGGCVHRQRSSSAASCSAPA